MEKRFTGKTVLITGGAGAIGSRIARRFALEGANVVICDRTQELCDQVCSDLQNLGAKAMGIAVDVKKSDDARRAVQQTVETFGSLDQLVTVAGGSTRGKMCYFVDQDEAVMLDNIGVNFLGALYFAHASAKYMAERKSGNIIFITSVLATNGQRGCVEYSAGKGALLSMARALGMEMGEFGVRVNCVSPGLVERGDRDVSATNYLVRNCTQDEIANVVAFLASDEASFVTCQNYIVDGGWGTGIQEGIRPMRESFLK